MQIDTYELGAGHLGPWRSHASPACVSVGFAKRELLWETLTDSRVAGYDLGELAAQIVKRHSDASLSGTQSPRAGRFGEREARAPHSDSFKGLELPAQPALQGQHDAHAHRDRRRRYETAPDALSPLPRDERDARACVRASLSLSLSLARRAALRRACVRPGRGYMQRSENGESEDADGAVVDEIVGLEKRKTACRFRDST